MAKRYIRKWHKWHRAAAHYETKSKQAPSVAQRNGRLYSEHEILTTCFNSFLNDIMSLYERTTVNTVVIDGIEITRRGKNRAVDEVIEEYRKVFWYKYHKLTERQISIEVSRLLNLVVQIVGQTSASETKGRVNQLVKEWLEKVDEKFGWKVAQHKYNYYQDLIEIYSKIGEEKLTYKRPTVVEEEPAVKHPTVNEPPHHEPEIQHHKPTYHKNRRLIRLLLSALKLAIPLILLAAAILYVTLSTITYNVVEEIPKVKATLVNESLPSQISFKEYLTDIYKYEGENATLNGFLSTYIKGDEMSGVYVQSLVDDSGNRIDMIKLTPKLKSFFPTKGTTNETYASKGVFYRNYKTLEFAPTSIEPYVRPPAKQVEKVVTTHYTENVTRTIIKPKYPQIRNFVYTLLGKPVTCEDGTILNNCSPTKPFLCSIQGLIKNPTKCGCPEGERIYKKECIQEVKCSDGTLEPECSENKPKQCINGTLVDNADQCGCPEGDFRQKGRSCEKILRCSDKTIYGECSKEKPLFCQDGILTKKPRICGCPSGTVLKGDGCLDKKLVTAMEAVDYVNELRKNNGKKPIKFDERVWHLAVARAKDMSDNNYLDHTNPITGACPDNMKKDFGLSFNEYVAENGYGSPDYAYYSAAEIEAVDSWITSRGHRYNLFYDNHVAGAVGCYKSMCTFLGLNYDGFGAGCHTAAEGVKFWQQASAQPGEI